MGLGPGHGAGRPRATAESWPGPAPLPPSWVRRAGTRGVLRPSHPSGSRRHRSRTPPQLRGRRRAPYRDGGSRPAPGVATGRGRLGHLHQLEDVVRLPVLGHFRGYVVRGGGRVHAAVRCARSLETAVARAGAPPRHQHAPAPWRPPSLGPPLYVISARPPALQAGARLGPRLLGPRDQPPGGRCFPARASLRSLHVSAGPLRPLQQWPSRTRGASGGPPVLGRSGSRRPPPPQQRGWEAGPALVPPSHPDPGVGSSVGRPSSALGPQFPHL